MFIGLFKIITWDWKQLFYFSVDRYRKEWIISHKLEFSNPYFLATWWWYFKLINFFQTELIDGQIMGLISGCRDLGIKNQTFWQKLNSFRIWIRKIFGSWIRIQIRKNVRIHGSGSKGLNINQKLKEKISFSLSDTKSELLKKERF